MARRILIAGDEPSILVSLEFLLHGAGYEVTIARDGEEALEAAERVKPDLMLLDVMLPAVNGFVQRIKANAAGMQWMENHFLI